jgi:lipid A 4'-phosphatase
MFLGVSRLFWIGAIASALALISFSRIDVLISSLFYSDGVWYLKDVAVLRFLYDYAPYITACFVFGCVAIGFATLIYRAKTDRAGKMRFFFRRRYLLLFLVASYALGPGLVVNTIFKDQFGRARPSQIEEFGGDKRFSPPLIAVNECDKNCSFSSGHATVGFYFVSFALIVSGNLSKAIFAFAILYGSLIGFARIAQGGHFFSDVAFSFIFVYLTAKILFYLMFDRLKLERGIV